MSDERSPRESSGVGPELPQLPSLDDVPVPAPGSSIPGTSGSGMRPSASLAAGLAPSSSFDWHAIGRKIGRVAAWIGGLILVFLISAWISLPTRSIAWRISHEARKAGFNISVDDVKVRPWGSATLENVVWNFKPSRPDSTPVPFVIDELDLHFSVVKYVLFDTIDADFEAYMDEGAMSGAYYESKDESHVEFEITELPLYGVPKLQEAVNAPVRGMFALSVDITAPGNEWAKSNGKLEVHCYSCTVGDGDTKLFVPGSKKTSMLSKGVTIPEIDLGTLDGVLEIVDGKAVAEEFGTESEDIVFRISGDIEFKDPIGTSRLNLLIKTFIDPSLRQRSDQVDLLVLTASEKVKMDPPDEGWMGVVLEGNFKHRRFRGIKSLSRQERLRQKREQRRAHLSERAQQRAARRAEQKAAQEAAAAAAEGGEEGEDEGEDEGDEEEPQEVEQPEEGSERGERTIPPEVGVVLEERMPEGDEIADEAGEGEGGEDESGEDETTVEQEEGGDEAGGDEAGGEEETEEQQLPQ